MRLIHGPGGPLPHIPDDLTVPQFMLDVSHSIRPKTEKSRPWMIEEATGREVGEDEVSAKLWLGDPTNTWKNYYVQNSPPSDRPPMPPLGDMFTTTVSEVTIYVKRQ